MANKEAIVGRHDDAALLAVTALRGFAIDATDGAVGRVEDVYFDDDRWAVRYLVVKTGRLLDHREVLVSPIALERPSARARTIRARLTRDKIRHGPHVDVDKPVGRQHEVAFNAYYGWPSYWGGSGLWGMWNAPLMMARRLAGRPPSHEPPHGDPHLRSVREVTGYRVHALDGNLGHVRDFIIDDETWQIHYLVVETAAWFGKRTLVTPAAIGSVKWSLKRVDLLVTRARIEASPAWGNHTTITHDYEDRLRAYYAEETLSRP
jgi:uncharacterized protein YrrD